MCILFIAVRQHPDYPLVIAANRDEFYARPSSPMAYWQDQSQILAGRDLQAGGTWLGTNIHGEFAAITNFRNPNRYRDDARSRGELVVGFLKQYQNEMKINQFEDFLNSKNNQYNPFNLVFGDPSGCYVWGYGNNRCEPLTNGFHSISNGPIEQSWPKMSRGVKLLTDYVKSTVKLEPTKILPIMQDSTEAATDQLPNTGVDVHLEQTLSSIFIKGEQYGTRTTTVLLYRQHDIQVNEWNYSSEYKVENASAFCIEY